MNETKQEIGCSICGKEAEIFPDGMPFCLKCYDQKQTGEWRNDIKARVDAFSSTDSMAGILHKAVESTGLSECQIKEKKRKREIVEVRQICMYLSLKYLDVSLCEIGDFFGGYDRNTVNHAFNVVSDLIRTNEEFKKKYTELLNF